MKNVFCSELYKSIYAEVICKQKKPFIDALQSRRSKEFSNFTGKQLRKNLFFETPTQVLSSEICEVLKNTPGGCF